MKKVQQHLDIIHKHGQKILTLDNFYIKVTFNLGNLEFITWVHAYLRLCQIYKSPYHCQWRFRITLENLMPPLVMCIVQCLFIQDCASNLSARHSDSIFLQNFKEFLSNFVMLVFWGAFNDYSTWTQFCPFLTTTYLNVGKNWHFWTTSLCPRSHWMSPCLDFLFKFILSQWNNASNLPIVQIQRSK